MLTGRGPGSRFTYAGCRSRFGLAITVSRRERWRSRKGETRTDARLRCSSRTARLLPLFQSRRAEESNRSTEERHEAGADPHWEEYLRRNAVDWPRQP